MYKVIQKRACRGFNRITKNYFISILPSLPDTQFVIDVATGNRVRIDSVMSSKKSMELRNGLYRNKYKPIEKAYPRKLLEGLEDKDWTIKSFNSTTREICFSIKEHNFSYVIPERFIS